jgi:hypothetical protein
MSKVFVLEARQNGRPLPVEINYGKVIWSGLSWAVGEIKHTTWTPGQPITVECSSAESDEVRLEGRAFVVRY